MEVGAKICYGCMTPLDKDYDLCPYLRLYQYTLLQKDVTNRAVEKRIFL